MALLIWRSGWLPCDFAGKAEILMTIAQPTEKSEVSQKPWIPDSAIILAIITATAYFLTLRYEAGMCNYFNIPLYFVVLDYTKVMFRSSSFIYMLVVMSLAYAAYMKVSNICSQDHKKYICTIFALFLCFLGVFIYRILYKHDFLQLLIAGSMVLVTLYRIIHPLIKHRGKKSYDRNVLTI
jgi:hypothetical protein